MGGVSKNWEKWTIYRGDLDIFLTFPGGLKFLQGGVPTPDDTMVYKLSCGHKYHVLEYIDQKCGSR